LSPSQPPSDRLRGLPGGPTFARNPPECRESGERQSWRVIAAVREIEAAAPGLAKAKVDPDPLEIHRQRSLADLELAERIAAGGALNKNRCALARDIGVNETTVRIVQTHAQRNPPWHWLRAMSDKVFVAIIVSMARDRSSHCRSTLQEELATLDAEELAQPRSA
jgi:hypothetical protein